MKQWWDERSNTEQTWLVNGGILVLILIVAGAAGSGDKGKSASTTVATRATRSAIPAQGPITITSPHDGQRVLSAHFNIRGRGQPGQTVHVAIGGADGWDRPIYANGKWVVHDVKLPSTDNTIVASYPDNAASETTVDVHFGPKPPPPPPPKPPSAAELAAQRASRARQEIRQEVADADLLGKDPRVSFTSTGNHHFTAKITYKLADNLTKGLVESGAKDDAKQLFQAVYDGHDNGLADAVIVDATSKLVDTFGHESTGVAYRLYMPGDLGRQINWDNQVEVDFGQAWTHLINRIK